MSEDQGAVKMIAEGTNLEHRGTVVEVDRVEAVRKAVHTEKKTSNAVDRNSVEIRGGVVASVNIPKRTSMNSVSTSDKVSARG